MRDDIINQYINEILDEIMRVESLKTDRAKSDPQFLNIWMGKIEQTCEDFYEDYLMGKRQHFYMNVEEYDNVFNEAGLEYSNSLLEDLLDNGDVQAVVTDTGNLMYKKS